MRHLEGEYRLTGGPRAELPNITGGSGWKDRKRTTSVYVTLSNAANVKLVKD